MILNLKVAQKYPSLYYIMFYNLKENMLKNQIKLFNFIASRLHLGSKSYN